MIQCNWSGKHSIPSAQNYISCFSIPNKINSLNILNIYITNNRCHVKSGPIWVFVKSFLIQKTRIMIFPILVMSKI